MSATLYYLLFWRDVTIVALYPVEIKFLLKKYLDSGKHTYFKHDHLIVDNVKYINDFEKNMPIKTDI
jgi:hypothetical protein